MQGGINVQGGFFLKINKRADPNKTVQGEFFLKINKRACTSIRHTRVSLPYKYHYGSLLSFQTRITVLYYKLGSTHRFAQKWKIHKTSYYRLAHLLLTSKDGVLEMDDVIPHYGIQRKKKDVFEDIIATKSEVKKT